MNAREGKAAEPSRIASKSALGSGQQPFSGRLELLNTGVLVVAGAVRRTEAGHGRRDFQEFGFRFARGGGRLLSGGRIKRPARDGRSKPSDHDDLRPGPA